MAFVFEIGIRSGPARSTALFQLATELPAAILARMLGIHVAVAWQHASAGDWATYAADVAHRPKKGDFMNQQHRAPAPTRRLAFGQMTGDDLDDIAALLGDPGVMRYYPRPKDRDEALAWIEWNQRLYRQEGFGLWLVTLRATGEFVGDCGLTPQEIEGTIDIEVGYHVRADLQGHGYATEAVAACRDYARDVLSAKRLIALPHQDNTPSQRVAEKIGLSRERDAISRSGQPIRIYATAP